MLLKNSNDWTPSERAAYLTYLLTGVRCALTTQEAARAVGLSSAGALWLLNRISRKVPIRLDQDQVWRFFSASENLRTKM
jgi:hypothetical protein